MLIISAQSFCFPQAEARSRIADPDIRLCVSVDIPKGIWSNEQDTTDSDNLSIGLVQQITELYSKRRPNFPTQFRIVRIKDTGQCNLARIPKAIIRYGLDPHRQRLRVEITYLVFGRKSETIIDRDVSKEPSYRLINRPQMIIGNDLKLRSDQIFKKFEREITRM